MRALITSSAIAKEGGMGLGQPIAWYSLASALAVAFGVAAAFGGKLLMIFAFGAMGGLVLLFAPVQLVLRLFLFLCFLVVGPLTSIADIQQALWAPYMIALVLLVRTPMEWNHTSTLKYRRPGIAGEEVSPVMWAVVCYFALMLVSFAVNFPEPMQGLVAAKLYVFVWGVFFLLVVSSVSPQTLERMWKGFLLIAFLQFPFALYQRFVEVPRRTHFDTGGTGGLDAVVGTFPGTEAGGASGAFAVFLVFSMALAISLRRNKVLGRTATFVVVFASLASIALGEVKVIIVLFPLAFVVLNRHEIIARPASFLVMTLFVASILGGLFWVFQSGTKDRSGPDRSVLEHIGASFDYVLNPKGINFKTGEISRGAALNLWYRDGRQTLQTVLVGYGPAASQYSTQARGEVASRFFPLTMNKTTAAGMLWDIGVLGFGSFVAVVIIAFVQALRLSNSPEIPTFHRSVLEACAVLFAMVGVTLPYSNDMLITPPLQVAFLISLAQVVYWHLRAKAQSCSAST